MHANNAAAECLIPNVECHTPQLHFCETANIGAVAIRLNSLWLLGRILEFFEIDLWLAPNLLMFGLVRKDTKDKHSSLLDQNVTFETF
jgi:hypothetical protein